MAVAKATQVIMQKAKEQGIPLTPLQAQQMAIEELLKQPWIQETGIGDMYNQIKTYNKCLNLVLYHLDSCFTII